MGEQRRTTHQSGTWIVSGNVSDVQSLQVAAGESSSCHPTTYCGVKVIAYRRLLFRQHLPAFWLAFWYDWLQGNDFFSHTCRASRFLAVPESDFRTREQLSVTVLGLFMAKFRITIGSYILVDSKSGSACEGFTCLYLHCFIVTKARG